MEIDLVGGYLGLAVKGDEGHVGDLGVGSETVFGIDGVRDVSHAPSGSILRWEKTSQHVGRKARIGIEGLEDGGDLARCGIEARLGSYFILSSTK